MKAFNPKLLLIAALLIGGCTKNNLSAVKQNNELTIAGNATDFADGVYSGKFIGIINWSGTTPTTLTGPVTVTVNNHKFHSTANANWSPAGGDGTFTLTDHVVNFRDTVIHTANFDWSLILNDSYTYSTKGDSVILVKTSGASTYTYRLKKQ